MCFYSEICNVRTIYTIIVCSFKYADEKCGIYEISCKDCNQKYVGQTRRSIQTRFKEHMAHLKYGRTEKSSVAQHAFDNNHRIDKNNLRLIRNVRNNRQLDAFESLEISRCLLMKPTLLAKCALRNVHCFDICSNCLQ